MLLNKAFILVTLDTSLRSFAGEGERECAHAGGFGCRLVTRQREKCRERGPGQGDGRIRVGKAGTRAVQGREGRCKPGTRAGVELAQARTRY